MFYCMQGVNVKRFVPVAGENIKDTVIMHYPENKLKAEDIDALLAEARPFLGGRSLDLRDSIRIYLQNQTDKNAWEKFCCRYKIKISSEFRKILIELGIKSWIRGGLSDPTLGLPIEPQPFEEQEFWNIYVRSPRRGNTKAVAVRFLYRYGKIYIQEILSDIRSIQRKFPFLGTRKTKTGDKLLDNQQYYVDENAGHYISCYTSPFFTPVLIGRPHLLDDTEMGKIKISRANDGDQGNRLLPLVSHYNSMTKPINRIRDRVCFDLKPKTYIQYFVPPRIQLGNQIKRGFRVYHLYGKTYKGDQVYLSTDELLCSPIVALHFNTLTQNVLRIGENSQSSLLQKIAKVLIEN